MRNTWLFILLFICVISKAQIPKTEIYAVAGLNNTTVVLKNNSSTSMGNWQWQAGGLVVLPSKTRFYLYSGLLYENKFAHAVITNCCSGTAGESFDYKIGYLTLLIGAGYQLPSSKKKFRFGAVLFYSFATGGSMKGNDYGGSALTFSSMYPYRGPYRERKLSIGGSPNNDISSIYPGAQVNASAIFGRLLLQAQYQFSLVVLRLILV